MEKAVVNMTNWELYVYNDRYNLSGIADSHPNLGKDAYVRSTSSLVNYNMDKDVLTYETRNTIYVCHLKYMTLYPYRNVVSEYIEKLKHRADDSDNCLDQIIAATAKIATDSGNDDAYVKHIKELQKQGQQEIKEMEEMDDARLCDMAKNYEDCVYIEVSNIDSGNKLAYHLGDYTGTVSPCVHSGMFQDSVLYMKYGSEYEDNDCRLDFRYFPMGFGSDMETYSWSDNIKLAVIKNDCQYEIRFNKETIQPGETRVFTPDNYRQGLVSPDCYNGKSVLFDSTEKE